MPRVTIHDLQALKDRGQPIAMLTAYDYPTAQALDQSGVDMILVGDSVGMVVHGLDNTLGVTMDMMVMHCAAVRRGVERAFIVGDMPFMSYQASQSEAKRNAARLLVEGGADAVKVEGGQPVVETVRALVDSGIAVQGHIGLTPQHISAFGGFTVQGKTLEKARQLLIAALALQDAGAFSIVLEAIPARLATFITERLTIPTIGIGAGPGCDGQVLVLHDILGLYKRFSPKFAQQYADLDPLIREAVVAYKGDVRAGSFPAPKHTYRLDDDTWDKIARDLEAFEG